MKYFAVRFTLALVFLFAAVNAHAQFADVTGGSLTITVSDSLNTLLATKGLSAAGFTAAPYDNQIPYLGINGGVFSLANGRGSFTVQGEFDITDGTNTLQVAGINFENVNAKPQITGSVYYNSHFVGHIGALCVDNSNPMGPLAAGPFMTSGVHITLSPALIVMINNVWGLSVPANTDAAQLSINTGLAPI